DNCNRRDRFPWRGVVVPTAPSADQVPSYELLEAVDTAAISNGAAAPPVCFVYSGQGCQWEGMARDLSLHNRTFRATADEACEGLTLPTLTPTPPGVAPPTAVTVADLFDSGAHWMDRRVSGLGITLVQIGLTAVLTRDFGVRPDYIIGHSVGEV